MPKVIKWFDNHKLTVNAGKTRIMHIDSNPGETYINKEKIKTSRMIKLPLDSRNCFVVLRQKTCAIEDLLCVEAQIYVLD